LNKIKNQSIFTIATIIRNILKKTIVSAKWLHKNLNDPNLIILDASPAENKSGLKTEFEGWKIPNSRFFDLKNKFSKKLSELPNTLPSTLDFEAEARKLGINKSSKIVVYDNLGIYTSPRVWWMFKTMGHKSIAVLNGGLPEWAKNGFEIQAIKNIKYTLGDFKATFKPVLVKNIEDIKNNLKTKTALLIDARSEGRFNGTAPDPRATLKSGHIPNSVNLPYTEVLNNGKLKSKEKLTPLFNKVQTIDLPLIFSCGSGITACILHLAAEQVVKNEKSVYDGSWTEWASSSNNQIETN
jgi:thiosulfate/3-mercaptopyruvate sulfurtransferase